MHSQPRLEPERVDLRGREPEHRARPERHSRAARARGRRRRGGRRHQRVHARERVAGGGVDVEAQLVRRVRLQEHTSCHASRSSAGSSRRRSCARACRARASSPCASRPRARGRRRDAPREDGHVGKVWQARGAGCFIRV